MNRTDYVKAIATVTGFTQKDVKAVLDAAQTVAYEAMANEEEVKVFDGVTLVGIKKAACVKRNPLTGADVQVPEKIAPKAKFGKAIKDAINA